MASHSRSSRSCPWNARHRGFRLDPDAPLNRASEALNRLVNEARFVKAWRSGVRGDELMAVAIPCIVDEWVEGVLADV